MMQAGIDPRRLGGHPHRLSVQDLPAVTGRCHPGRRADRRPEMVAASLIRFPEMWPHPPLQLRPRPPHRLQFQLSTHPNYHSAAILRVL